MKLAVIMDMFGCPNRCRHCWLPHHRNANIPLEEFTDIAEQFKNYKRDGRPFFTDLLFNTWYREPDFPDNYRQIWELEHELSTGKFSHFELASVWRLVRDQEYAPWLKNLDVNCVQLTFFGTEENTDYFTGRKGAYHELLDAIDILLQNDIAPRIQLFPFRTTVDDFENLLKAFEEISLEKRVNSLGREFACFFNTITPIGEAQKLEDIRLDQKGLQKLPYYFTEKTLKHFNIRSIDQRWKTEAEWLPSLLEDDQPLNDTPDPTAFMIDPGFNIYPNCGEIAPWWCLGNIKTDSLDIIVDYFLDRDSPGLRMNYEVPVNYFAKKYGNEDNHILWERSDLVHRWIRKEGLASKNQ